MTKQEQSPAQTAEQQVHSNLEAIRGLQPSGVYEAFARFCDHGVKIGQEAPVREMLASWAAAYDFPTVADGSGNMAIHVPGRGAGAGQKPVIVQFHMDMVCEPPSHDFNANPIRLFRDVKFVEGREQEVLWSRGITTIGADNRLAGAMAQSAAIDPALTDAPPMIILATWGEEAGLVGARALDPTLLGDAELLINLDNEALGEVLNACAGQATVEVKVPLVREAIEDRVPVLITLQDYPGGHSGMTIHEQRGNALKDLVEAFSAFLETVPPGSVRLAAVTGGGARNAIPISASILAWAKPADALQLMKHFRSSEVGEAFIEKVDAAIRQDAGLTPRVEATVIEDVLLAGNFHGPFDADSAGRILRLLTKLPHGVAEWDGDPANKRPALSSNLGIARTSTDQLHLTLMARNVHGDVARSFLQRKIEEGLMKAELGANFDCVSVSSGWDGTSGENRVIQAMRNAYSRVLGREPVVTSIHAGIECGEFAILRPSLQQGSAGPTIKGGHTVNEMILIETVEPAYKFLLETLRELALTGGAPRH